MSHFYAELQGNRGRATRCGTKKGMYAHIRGWNKGIWIECNFDEATQQDVFSVYETGGSNDGGTRSFIKEIRS